jgi:hypothetical protein
MNAGILHPWFIAARWSKLATGDYAAKFGKTASTGRMAQHGLGMRLEMGLTSRFGASSDANSWDFVK